MVDPAVDVVLLSSIALRGLIVVPGLLLLRGLPLSTIIELSWSVLYVPLGTTVSIVSRLTTPEANIASSGSRVVDSHGGTSGSVDQTEPD